MCVPNKKIRISPDLVTTNFNTKSNQYDNEPKNLNWVSKIDKSFNDFTLKEKFEWFYEIYYKYFLNEYNKLIEVKKQEKIEKEKLEELNNCIKLDQRFKKLINTLKDIITIMNLIMEK